MRGGGRHKDKNKAKKKQAVSQERLERKCDEEPESDIGPAIQESEEKKQVTSEEQVSSEGPASLKSLWCIEKDRAIQSIEEDERYRKVVDVSEGSDVEVEQKTG